MLSFLIQATTSGIQRSWSAVLLTDVFCYTYLLDTCTYVSELWFVIVLGAYCVDAFTVLMQGQHIP